MITNVGRIVTSAAGAWNRYQLQVVIESRNAGNLDRLRIEQDLAPGDAGAPAILVLALAMRWATQPGTKQREDHGREGRIARVPAEGIVNPDKKRRRGDGCECRRAACGTIGIQSARPKVDRLC